MRPGRGLLGAAAAASLALAGGPAWAASDYLLTIDGLADGAADAGGAQPGAIEVESWSLGGAMSSLTIIRAADKASPALAQARARGAHFASVTLTVRRVGGPPLVYAMTDATIADIHAVGAARTESVTFTYARIERGAPTPPAPAPAQGAGKAPTRSAAVADVPF